MNKIKFSNHATVRLLKRAPGTNHDLVLKYIRDKIDAKEYRKQDDRDGYIVSINHLNFVVDSNFSKVITVLVDMPKQMFAAKDDCNA